MPSLVASVPVGMLFVGALALFLREKALSSLLQLLGAVGLAAIVLAHFSEALHLLPSMGWGLDRSAGHYLDLGSVVLGGTAFPLGYVLHVLNLLNLKSSGETKRSARRGGATPPGLGPFPTLSARRQKR